MRIAITGASGYVGGCVRRAAAARGDRWIGLTRRPATGVEATGHEWVSGELADAAALDRLVHDCDALVHAAAWVHRETPDEASREACFAVNLRGTERLLEALKRRGVRVPFVFVSSTSVYGDQFADRDESGPCEPAGAYGESKLAAEKAVLEFGRATGTPVVITRPAMVYGAGAPGNIAKMAAFVRRGFAPLVGGGRNAKSIVHGDDLAATLLAAVDRASEMNGAILNVAGEPPMTMREVGDALAKGLGKSVTWVPVPGPLWALGAALGHALAGGGKRANLGRTMETYASTTTVRARAVVDRLGAKFRDAREGIAASVR